MFTAKYCPVINGMVRTCILATGQEGVLRVHRFNLDSSDKDIQEDLADEFPPLQPESFDFILVDLAIGKQYFLHILLFSNIKFQSSDHVPCQGTRHI